MSLNLLLQLTISGIVAGSTYALLGVSFGIIYSTTRIFHLAHAAAYAGAAYAAVWLAEIPHVPLAAALVGGLIVGTLIGVLVNALGYRPMVRRQATLLSLFLVSLGITIAAPNVLQLIFGPDNRTIPQPTNSTLQVGSATVTSLDIIATGLSWVLIFGVVAFVNLTRAGRAITAMRTNPTMATAVGIDGPRIYLTVFMVGSALVSVAGLLFMLQGVATPTMGLEPVLIGFIAAFLGGIGHLGGAALGGLILGLLTSWSAMIFQSTFAPAVAFGIMFLLLMFKPQGLFGRASA